MHKTLVCSCVPRSRALRGSWSMSDASSGDEREVSRSAPRVDSGTPSQAPHLPARWSEPVAHVTSDGHVTSRGRPPHDATFRQRF